MADSQRLNGFRSSFQKFHGPLLGAVEVRSQPPNAAEYDLSTNSRDYHRSSDTEVRILNGVFQEQGQPRRAHNSALTAHLVRLHGNRDSPWFRKSQPHLVS